MIFTDKNTCMSTKTIALELSVYEKLRRQKRESESFTRTIDRLIENSRRTFTCEAAVADASAVWGQGLSPEEEKTFNEVIESGRKDVSWKVERPE